MLTGGSPDDRFFGNGETGAGVATGGGADKLDGGAGNDQLWGGGGSDRFVFEGLPRSAILWDFGQSPGNHDVIGLRRTEAGDPTNGQLQVYYVNGNAILEINGGRITAMCVTHLDNSDVLKTYRNGAQSLFESALAYPRVASMSAPSPPPLPWERQRALGGGLGYDGRLAVNMTEIVRLPGGVVPSIDRLWCPADDKNGHSDIGKFRRCETDCDFLRLASPSRIGGIIC